jgi:hypothetical protein
MNVRMNRPTTSTEQMLATASNGVSSTLAAEAASGRVAEGSWGTRFFFFAILSLVAVLLRRLQIGSRLEINAPHGRCAASAQIL